MIYLADDYVAKYSDSLSYLIGRSYHDGYSFDFIQKAISYSLPIRELEQSNVTTIAFSSMEKMYDDIFTAHNNDYEFDAYGIFGWVGYAYIHLFLSLKTTFEALFFLIPIQEMVNLYRLYHEMDITQLIEYAKDKRKYTLLDIVMKEKKISNKDLSLKTNLSAATISALRYGKRDINKLESSKLLILSRALSTKMETLLPDICLITSNYLYN